MNHFSEDKLSALQSIEQAQRIAYAPIIFQAAIAMRDFGLMEKLDTAEPLGLTMDELCQDISLSRYGVRVLIEASLGIGIVTTDDVRYKLTKTGHYLLHDEMTRVNMDFVQDICYQGMFSLKESIQTGKPTGLKSLGTWNTVYEGLAHLPPQEQKSWFSFDHYYSSDSFPIVLPHVFKNQPAKLLDIGGNTGKWALTCFNHDPNIKVTIADLPGQLNMAEAAIQAAGFSDRITLFPTNLLDPDKELPTGFDAIWMSQFLDCFSEDEIVSILQRCHRALNEDGRIFILEPFWDRQKFAISAFCLQMTSLYFTNIANGNSQMYDSRLFAGLVEKAGFKVTECIDRIGVSHSLMICEKA